MKKLITGVLAGVFISTGASTVFANGIALNVERHALHSVASTLISESGHIAGIDTIFTRESIEIDEILQIVNHQWIDNLVDPIINSIDVTSINPNDWAKKGLLSALSSDEGSTVLNDIVAHVERFVGNLDGRIRFTASINGDMVDAGIVLDNEYYAGVRISMQDIINTGLFSLRDLVSIASLVQVENLSGSSNEFDLVHVNFSDVQDLINSGVISYETIIRLAEIAELRLSHR